jgi:hypothetical protein
MPSLNTGKETAMTRSNGTPGPRVSLLLAFVASGLAWWAIIDGVGALLAAI